MQLLPRRRDKSVKKVAEDAQASQKHLNDIVEALSTENKSLKKELIRSENYSKNQNVKFFGIPESQGETVHMLIDIFHRVLYIFHIDPSACHIYNIHRLPSNTRGPRPVIIKFVSMLERNLVWESSNMLKDCELKLTIHEKFTSVTKSNIRMLFPIWRAAMNQKLNARLIQDILYINNQLYTVDSLGQLPDSIKPQNAAIREDDKHITWF